MATAQQGSKMNEVRFVDVKVDHEDLENSVYKVLAELRSGWKKEEIKRKYIDENSALANRTFVCYVTDDFKDAVVFRLHTDRLQQFVNREISMKSFLLFNEIGVAPNLICRLQNGICCDYVKGETFSKDDQEKLKDISIAKNVAKELAKIHAKSTTRLAEEKYEMNRENSPWNIFDVLMDSWPTSYTDPECQKLIDSKKFPSKDEFMDEKRIFEKHIDYLHLPYGFCHNDSGFGNVIFIEKEDRAVLVDYDVCGYNYHLLDLAQYTVGAALGYPRKDDKSQEKSLLPQEAQRVICRTYLETIRHLDSWDRDVIDDDVEALYIQLQKMSFFYILYRVAVSAILASLPNVGRADISPLDILGSAVETWKWFKEEGTRIKHLLVPEVPPRHDE